MFDPQVVMLPTRFFGSGYEVFSYKGTTGGQKSFWLRHVIQKIAASKRFSVEISLSLFDRKTGQVKTLYAREEIDFATYHAMSKSKRWDNFRVNFQSGSFIELFGRTVRGKLYTAEGNAAWELIVKREDKPLLSFGGMSFYQLPLPPVKSLIPDSALSFKGRISAGDQHWAGEFTGFSQHVWGSAALKSGARVSCMQFKEQGIVFDALCGQLSVAGNTFTSPMITLATLRINQKTYRFTELSSLKNNTTETLDNYRWRALFKNSDYRLEMDVDGANPHAEPWVALNYSFMQGKRRVAKQTPFAAGRLILTDLKTDQVVVDLRSDYFDLETLLNSNEANSDGLIATP